MTRISIPAFLLFVTVAGLALTGFASFQLATAHADMAPDPMAEVSIRGSAEGATLVYRLTNTGRTPVELGQPHLVVLDRGVRLPMRVTALELDGAAHGVHEPFTLAPGQTVVLRLTLEARRPGEIELRFYRGNVAPYRMSA